MTLQPEAMCKNAVKLLTSCQNKTPTPKASVFMVQCESEGQQMTMKYKSSSATLPSAITGFLICTSSLNMDLVIKKPSKQDLYLHKRVCGKVNRNGSENVRITA